MPFRLHHLAPMLALLLSAPTVRGGDAPQAPPEPAEEARLVVVGQVSATGVHDEEHDDGGKTRWVMLRVQVESVVKGYAAVKAGETIHVLCRTPVRPASDGTLPGGGQHAIPGNGGRAKFYLSGETLGIWPAVAPNGIEPLDETPRLEFPIEPVGAPRSRAGRGRSRLLVYGAAAGLLLVALLRSRRRAAGVHPPDQVHRAPASPA